MHQGVHSKEKYKYNKIQYVKDKGSCFGGFLLCMTGKLLQQEKGCFVFLLLEDMITALNVCKRTRNRARLELQGC